MTLDRTPWKASFTADGRLPWFCPYCHGSRLAGAKSKLLQGETGDSRDSHGHEAWEPEWIDGRFAALLSCPHCQGQLAVAGTYRIRDARGYDAEGNEVGDYLAEFTPRYFSDPPHILRLPERTPGAVRDALVESFQLYWTDLESCANRFRSAVELLLTQEGVRQTTGKAKPKGRRIFLRLSERIERFSEKQPNLAQSLNAIRWLGNAGSHAGHLTQDDVLDGYEILEYVLDQLYVHRARRASALARSINRRRGPRSPRRRRG